ncbi:MAG: preprotein translocase subunit YidC [Spirochaetes bacterium]|nr:MAG: preprotein translocase subunit YidC [Spirochaetota bacterium]
MSIFDNGSKTQEESKRTILAVVLSTAIVGVGFMIQNMLFPPIPQAEAPMAQSQTVSTAAPIPTGTVVAGNLTAPKPAEAPEPAQLVQAPVAEARYVIETDLLSVELSNAGGEIVSLKLKNHKDMNGYVDMIVPGAKGSNGIALSFGPAESAPVKELMNVSWLDNDRKTIQFSRTFFAKTADSGEMMPFTYKKVFTFRPGEYMFGVAITLETENGRQLPLNSNGTAYTLSVGPQIGPRFDHLPKNADYRKYILQANGKKKTEMPKVGNLQSIKDSASWGSIVGKYFALIAIPETASQGFSFIQNQDPSINQTNTLYLSRPAISASSQTDKYYFYFGPKTSSQLARYEYADKNSFGLAGMKLEDATESSNILGWLETILKFFLNVFYKVIPNYGVAIILVTILIKVLFFPLTKKGSISTARMQELQPKIQELQAKYKGNPQKLNQEMAEFYKRENYNPMSGCLPMLIQFPLFIAMYNLFNNHFDLRGASFIPGWIFDLSLPESVINFGAFKLPLLGWSDIRALPIIYLASQLLYGKFTQTPQSGQNANQMKLMMYGMPIMFFFVLYDVPSGLLLYWIVSNVLTILQQIVINDMLKKHKLKVASSGPQPSFASPASGASNGSRMKTAGRTSVKSSGAKASSPQSQEGLGDKVKNWLEKKAGEASTSSKDKTGGKR